MPVDYRDPLVDQHNLNALLIGTGEFHFAKNATTELIAGAAGKGYKSFDNVKMFALQPEIEKKEHKGSYRGIRKIDKTIVTAMNFTYKLTFDAIGLNKLLLMFLGSEGTAYTQLIATAANADAMAFSTGASASGIVNWYDVLRSGVQVRDLTALTIATLVEGTDFVVDYKLGRVRFLVDQVASLVPVVTAPAITSSSTGYLRTITPFQEAIQKGIGRLLCYDQNSNSIVAFDHKGFGCELSVMGNTEFAEDVATIDVLCRVTSPAGSVFSREA